MEAYRKVLERTAADYDRVYADHPLFEMTLAGKLRTDIYIRYLIETYHMVKHTVHMLALGVAGAGPDRTDLRDWFIEQLDEERNHDLLLLKDLKNLGVPEEVVKKTRPGRGARGLITQNYYMTTYGNPVGILGVASLTEGLGATAATQMAECLNSLYRIPRNATTFLRSHGGFDVKHIEDVRRAINEIMRPDELEYVIHARRMTIYTYGQMFDDALEGAPHLVAGQGEAVAQ